MALNLFSVNQTRILCGTALISLLSSCGSVGTTEASLANAPGNQFDLRFWNITLPLDENNDDKVDSVTVKDIQDYSHPDFFYLDDENKMVFTSPNKALTTANSSNARSELRQMLRGFNYRIKTSSPKNNFALASNNYATDFASVGGHMEATLAVNHVALRARHPEKAPAFSVVVGQIHAGKDARLRDGFGAGNEPLKIYYKKLPGHDTGSIFWTYERNLQKEDPNRTDIAYPVWGNTWDNLSDPGSQGIELGEEFSYSVKVVGDVMTLNFVSAGHPDVSYEINLADNVDAYGNADEFDHPMGYAGDWMYFKAGAYNQCSPADKEGFWYAACPGTGDWETDKANGDYASVSFSRLNLSEVVQP